MLDELYFFIAVHDQPVETTTSNKGKGKKRKQKTPSEGPDQPVETTTERKKQKQKTSCNGPKKPRYCSLCKNPIKGHKNVKNCPKNKKK